MFLHYIGIDSRLLNLKCPVSTNFCIINPLILLSYGPQDSFYFSLNCSL